MDSQSLSALATTMAAGNPCAGRYVTVASGKHKGRSGRVLRQIKDAYSNDKYSANNILSGVVKTIGYVSLVRFDDGTQAWIKSNYLEVVKLYQAVNGDRCETRGAKVEAIAKFYNWLGLLTQEDEDLAAFYSIGIAQKVYNFVEIFIPAMGVAVLVAPKPKPKLKQYA